MANASNFLENKIIDWFFRAQAIGITGATAGANSGPANLYVGLCTSAPSDTGIGTEVTGNSYARVTVASGLTGWRSTQGNTAASTGTGGATTNNNAISFPTPSGSWGTVTHFIICDASSGGNLLFYGTLQNSRSITAGQDVSFPAGTLTITVA